jgi:hypothetical protein
MIHCRHDYAEITSSDVHREDILTRMHTPALQLVEVEIRQQYEVEIDEMLFMFSSAARGDMLSAKVEYEELFSCGLWD